MFHYFSTYAKEYRTEVVLVRILKNCMIPCSLTRLRVLQATLAPAENAHVVLFLHDHEGQLGDVVGVFVRGAKRARGLVGTKRESALCLRLASALSPF